MLRKLIAISFLCVFLCANTEIGQLLKLPNLLHHFVEHQNQKEEDKISIIDFVKIHYGEHKQHSHKDQQHNDHENLPFKTINASVMMLLAFENPKFVTFVRPETIAVTHTVPFRQDCYTSNVFACIWLPPKLG